MDDNYVRTQLQLMRDGGLTEATVRQLLGEVFQGRADASPSAARASRSQSPRRATGVQGNLINCPAPTCNRENDPANERCVWCDHRLELQIRVKGLQGPVLNLSVPRQATVRHLKQMLQDSNLGSKGMMIVVFQGRKLGDWGAAGCSAAYRQACTGVEKARQPTPSSWAYSNNHDDFDTQTLLEYNVQNGSELDMFLGMRGDIGEFGDHSGSIGIQFLKGQTATLEDARSIVRALEGQWGASYSFSASPGLVTDAVCKRMIRLLDAKHKDEEDLKLSLSECELASLADASLLQKLRERFGGDFDSIILRRVEACGKCIGFHTDVSKRVLQVTLNSDQEYSGGRLVFITTKGLEVPARSAGSATLHDNKVVHGVTQHERGTRYSLFLLESS